MKTSKVLLIDNYDSFTYNLKNLIQSVSSTVIVKMNDEKGLLDEEDFTHLVLSPGPKDPEDSGYCKELVQKWASSRPILGVCLGHQVLAAVYGGNIIKAPYPVHGKVSLVSHNGGSLFEGVPKSFKAARYHSLIVDESSLPDSFNIEASYDNIIMALSHKSLHSLHGLQFHPESFLSEWGHKMIINFLKMT